MVLRRDQLDIQDDLAVAWDHAGSPLRQSELRGQDDFCSAADFHQGQPFIHTG